MACCMLVSLLVGGVWSRSRADIAALSRLGRPIVTPPASAAHRLAERLGPRWGVWLALLTVAEIGAAFLVLVVLTTPAAHHSGHGGTEMTTMPGMTGMTLEPAGPTAGSVRTLLLLAGLLALSGVILAGGVRRNRWNGPATAAGLAVLVYLACVLPPIRDLAPRSHALAMLQAMLLLVAAPALLATTFARTRSGEPLPDRTIRLATPAAGIAFTVVMYAWHLPAPDAAAQSAAVQAVRLATLALAGLALWAPLLNDQRPELAGVRLASVLAAAVPSGILGIAMILAGTQIAPWPMSDATGPGPDTDQLLGGVVMMLADLMFLLPTAGRFALRSHKKEETA